MRAPWAAEAATCAAVASSWLASVGAEPDGGGDGGGLVARAVAAADRDQARRRAAANSASVIACRPCSVVAHLGDVGELALAGGVVHQADDADAVVRAEFGELLLQRLRADLGAQVQAVADAQARRRGAARRSREATGRAYLR